MKDKKGIIFNGPTGKICLYLDSIGGVSEHEDVLSGVKVRSGIYLKGGHVAYVKESFKEAMSMIESESQVVAP